MRQTCWGAEENALSPVASDNVRMSELRDTYLIVAKFPIGFDIAVFVVAHQSTLLLRNIMEALG